MTDEQYEGWVLAILGQLMQAGVSNSEIVTITHALAGASRLNLSMTRTEFADAMSNRQMWLDMYTIVRLLCTDIEGIAAALGVLNPGGPDA